MEKKTPRLLLALKDDAGAMRVVADLEGEGVEIARASSDAQAIAELLRGDFDVILVDTHMLGGKGLAQLMEDRGGPETVPVIYLVHEGEEVAPLYARRRGAIDHVLVGGDPAILKAKVALFTDLARRSGSSDVARARDEFAVVASHELRTPLSALTLQVQSLVRDAGRGLLEQNTLAKKLDVAARQTRRLTRLVTDLLDASRIQAGLLQLDVEDVEADAIVRDVARESAGELERAGCALELRLDANVRARWDRGRIGQLVASLLSNAMKYGRTAPVRVATSVDGGRVRIAISDQGIGVAAADRERIFRRFERAVSTQSYGGMGIGLYLVEQIARAHGGTVTVDSELGAGSTFIVDLPIRAEATALHSA